jgi:hypothetical protein
MHMHLYRARCIVAVGVLRAGGSVLAMRAGHPPEVEAALSVGRPVLLATVAPANGSSNSYTGVLAARTDSGFERREGRSRSSR